MNKKLYILVIGAAMVALAVACVSASSSSNTPLYILRMEQQSSKMNFLPTAVNSFSYTTENGCILDSCVTGYCGAILMGTDATCHTCIDTCADTCWNTCPYTVCTCYSSCYGSCVPTCSYTCASCSECEPQP
ncbi:MAG: hypothetical protein HXS48_26870 [Theionarchaea archaeon]|nr:MAG: hypothetical protein AYK19_04890 [Theionarchaea archaeon DG-70-1]MBU7030585.1 hypothetical protein [Theionarchaea archaeon]